MPITDPPEFVPIDPEKYKRRFERTLNLLGEYQKNNPKSDLLPFLCNLLELVRTGNHVVGENMITLTNAVSELVRDRDRHGLN